MAWVVTPPTPTAQPPPGWVTTPVSTTAPPKQGWVGTGQITITATLSGGGQLSVTTMARPFIEALLTGNGELFIHLLERDFRSSMFSGDGEFVSLYSQIHPAIPEFSGDGQADFDLVSNFANVNFNSDGVLEAWPDGLHANVSPGMSTAALFSGGGDLFGSFGEIHLRFLDFNSAGTLSGVLTPKIMAQLAGSGQLSAQAFEVYVKTLALLGSGALSATHLHKYLHSIGFTGAGSLVTLFQALLLPAGGGTGTISALTKQIYAVAAQLSGSGALTASVVGGGVRNADYLGNGVLSVAAIASFPRSVGLSGVGALLASVLQSFSRSTMLFSDGTIIAQTSQIYSVNTGFNDEFNRADDFAQIGNGWVARNGALGVYLNGAVPLTAATWCEASAPVVMNSDDMEVTITLGQYIGTPATGDYATILLGCNASGEGVFVFCNGAGGVTIYTQVDWALTGLTVQASIAATQTDGDKFTARRVGNVYTVLKNGVSTGLIWTDSTNIIPRDANHRLVGVAAYTADAVNARVIDSFSATDSGSLAGNGTLSATRYPVHAVTANFSGGGTLSATATRLYTPTSETNTARTNQPIPAGTFNVRVSLIGAGGGGGPGSGGSFSARGGGGGGGGGASSSLPFPSLLSEPPTRWYGLSVATRPQPVRRRRSSRERPRCPLEVAVQAAQAPRPVRLRVEPVVLRARTGQGPMAVLVAWAVTPAAAMEPVERSALTLVPVVAAAVVEIASAPAMPEVPAVPE